MSRSTLSALLLAVSASSLPADEPAVRPIDEAESVLAVYRTDNSLTSRGDLAVMVVAWPDGRVVWSGDRRKGGAPYRAGRVEPKKVAAFLARFEKDGLFADDKLNQPHFGPDSEFTTVLVKSGKRQVKMQSWHDELFVEPDGPVAGARGLEAPGARRRLDLLREQPADYLFFRVVWSETRAKLADLIPAEGTPTDGKPVMEAGGLSWQEPVGK